MRYVTIKELSDIIRTNLWKIPHDIDLVVGIPRSGMLAANMIALYLNKRLSDTDSFAEGYIYDVGLSRRQYIDFSEIRNVLVVDDSIFSGQSMQNAKEKLQRTSSKYSFHYLAVIAKEEAIPKVDTYLTIINDTRVFEWNLFHHSIITQSFLDMDGVICSNPTYDDDGEQYVKFLQTATPLYIPTVPIHTIATCRLEKYRGYTEQWLNKNGVKYSNLVMLDLPTRADRIKWEDHGKWKGELFKKSDASLFIESSSRQAKEIAEVSGKPVISIEGNELINISPISTRKLIKNYMRKHAPKTLNAYLRIRNTVRH